MDVENATNRELVEFAGRIIREGERRAAAAGNAQLVEELGKLHLRAKRCGDTMKSAGLIETFSGDDKDDPVVGP